MKEETQGDEEEDYNSISRQQMKVPGTEYSIIFDMSYNNASIPAHVDSGGHCNFVSTELVNELQLQLKKMKAIIIQYAKNGATSATDTGVQLLIEVALNETMSVKINNLCYFG